MKIGIVSKGLGGVEYHRLIKPFSLLNGEHDVTRCEGISSEAFDYGFDVVVFNRMLPILKQKEFILQLRKRGVYVICDIDDHWVLSGNHVVKKTADALRKQSIEALMYADEVWCTHELLGSYIDKLNSNWYVIPNAIDPNDSQWQPKTKYGNRIGWAGGVTHFHDLMLTKDAWGSTVPVICGFVKEQKEWARLADNFKADYIEALPVTHYGLLYDQFDIAIAPLEDNKFNHCKSNLKIIEAGMKGLPIFTQNIHPYIDEAKGVFKVDNWATALQDASSMDAETIEGLGAELRSYVLANYDLNKVNELRRERL
jgi:hypothetical protein